METEKRQPGDDSDRKKSKTIGETYRLAQIIAATHAEQNRRPSLEPTHRPIPGSIEELEYGKKLSSEQERQDRLAWKLRKSKRDHLNQGH